MSRRPRIRRINLEALKYVVEGIVASGKVVNGQLLANLMRVDKATISRNLKRLGVHYPKTAAGRSESSQDNEHRCHDEIAARIRDAIARENPAKPLSDTKLMRAIDFRGKLRNFTKIRRKYGIPSGRQRKRST